MSVAIEDRGTSKRWAGKLVVRHTFWEFKPDSDTESDEIDEAELEEKNISRIFIGRRRAASDDGLKYVDYGRINIAKTSTLVVDSVVGDESESDSDCEADVETGLSSSASSIAGLDDKESDGPFGEVMRQPYDQRADVLAEAKNTAPWRQASHRNECGRRLCLDQACPPPDSAHVQHFTPVAAHLPTQQNIAYVLDANSVSQAACAITPPKPHPSYMYKPHGYCLAWSPGPEVVSPQHGTSPTQTPNSTSLVGNAGCEITSSSKGSPKHASGGSARSGGGKHGRDRTRLEEKTTVMFRNLPNDYTRPMFLDLLDGDKKNMFWGRYDFVYLPIDLNRGFGLGFAFVNFLSHEDAEMARRHFQGFNDWVIASQKVCEVSWGDPLQGLSAHVERYRNSSVMHKDVVDEFRPVVFKNGVRVAFPSPSKHIRHPREAQRRRRLAMNRRAAQQRN
eukprot:TRINITY_DN6609_c0_g1_i2.p1 TRINITY_DN6609_c0_g1~~TRINITY_DN6609_c0_g1_i2.p1  ORF type:complete len:449 (-),score=58.62 TRINITY_DN6609_c0_g1_i2:511-1857(-)